MLDQDYKPESIEKLQNMLVKDISKKQVEFLDRVLVTHLNDTLIKLGFMMLARDCIERYTSPTKILSVWINYNINNFIYDTKAFLDSIAITLNYFYNLNFHGGEIDLHKGSFLSALEKNNLELSKFIRKNQNWIEVVTDWRLKLIHRNSLLVVPVGPLGHNPSDEKITEGFKKNPIMMPMEPISTFEFGKKTSEKLKKKYGKDFQEILPFCDEWLSNAKTIIETICQHISNDFKPKK